MHRWVLLWFIVSMVMLVVYIGLMFVSPFRKFTGKVKTICQAAAIFISLFSLVTAINVSGTKIELDNVEKFFAGIAETLNIFTLNEEYSNYIEAVKSMLGILKIVKLQKFFTYISSAIYILAPITIGTIIIEMLSSIKPKIKLFFLWFNPLKKIVYFSEPNERSLALAASIRNEGKHSTHLFMRPIIVFADVNSESGEDAVNFRLSAREIHGICFKNDLMHIGLRKKRKSEIFLIDTDEQKNLQLLSRLGEAAQNGRLKKARIYVFARDEASTRIKQEIQYKLSKTCCEHIMPDIKLISGHKHIVRNLMYDVPLFEPLVGKVNPVSEKYELNVTIFGAGSIGEEMFLSAYWYGQMLNCRLAINVVSRESRKQFEERINYINPDIFKTAERNSDILKIYDDREEYAEPYFKFGYYQTELGEGSVEDILTTDIDGFELINSDYFMVALGSDEADLMLAQAVGKTVGMHNLKEKKDKNAVVAYVIYNSDLCKNLNEARSAAGRLETGVYMHAFGSFKEFYSTKNVRMETSKEAAKHVSDAYEKKANDSIKSGFKNNFRKPDYKYWADIARALHIKYKVFSAGYIKASVFNCPNANQRIETNNIAFEEYRKIIPNKNDTEAEKKNKRGEKLYKELAWLEHRRWNAFMRTGGFRYKNFELYSKQINDYRCFEMRYQPCIVECDKNGTTYGLFDRTDTNGLDRLDSVIFNIHKANLEKMNLKDYDYPEFDFDDND